MSSQKLDLCCDIPRDHHHAARDGEDMAPTKRLDEDERRATDALSSTVLQYLKVYISP
jgi:hypothetical protein